MGKRVAWEKKLVRQFNMRLNERHSEMLKKLVDHYDMDAAGVLRMLIKREHRALQKNGEFNDGLEKVRGADVGAHGQAADGDDSAGEAGGG
jgi:hypothetical protein